MIASLGVEGESLARLKYKLDCGTLAVIYYNFDEGRNADEVNSAWRQIASRDYDGLDSLIHGARADSLNLDPPGFAHYARNGLRPRPSASTEKLL